MDCYWQPQSSMPAVPGQAVLFDRLDDPIGLPPPVSDLAVSVSDGGIKDQIEGGIGFAWLMLSIAAKHLARDPASDMGLMLYPKPGLEEAAIRLGQQDALGPADWTVAQEPLEKAARLRHLVDKTEQLRLAANTQGCTISPLYASCLFRYLEMVAGILSQ